MAKKEVMILQEELAEKQKCLEILTAQIDLLKQLIAKTTGEPIKPQRRAINVQALLTDLLEEVGPRGLNANAAVEMAKARGHNLKRGTVSSLLSRMKKDGVITYDDVVYRLKKFNPKIANVNQAVTSVILSHPASKSMT